MSDEEFKDDCLKEAAMIRKQSLLCTLEMMTGYMKQDTYEGDAEKVTQWMGEMVLRELNMVNFYALLDHTQFIIHWMAHEMDVSSEELFDRYVEFVHEWVMAFVDHDVLRITDEQFEDMQTVFDMEQMLKEDDE